MVGSIVRACASASECPPLESGGANKCETEGNTVKCCCSNADLCNGKDGWDETREQPLQCYQTGPADGLLTISVVCADAVKHCVTVS